MTTRIGPCYSEVAARIEFIDSLRRIRRTLLFLVAALLAAASTGCGLADRPKPAVQPADYRRLLAVTDVQSFLYHEPGTQRFVPQVRGSLRNLGSQTLVMVEFTLSFKDRLNRTIFEETAYPVYVSSLSQSQTGTALAPGHQMKFAFKSPSCPTDWEPGQVEVRVTKVVAARS